MKNGHLIVKGEKAGDLDWYKFTKAEDMTHWEFAAYEAYDACELISGKKVAKNYNCERDNINTLEDLFGKEFHDKFFCKKNSLLNDYYLEESYKELKNLTDRIDGLWDHRMQLSREWLALN